MRIRPAICATIAAKAGRAAANVDAVWVGMVTFPGLLRDEISRVIEGMLREPLPYRDVEILGVRTDYKLLSVFVKTKVPPY